MNMFGKGKKQIRRKPALGLQPRSIPSSASRSSGGQQSSSTSSNRSWWQLPQHLELLEDGKTTKMRLNAEKAGRDVLRATAKALQENATKLQDLWVDGQELELEISLAFAGALRTNNTLRILRLRGVRLSETGTSSIFGALRENRALTQLYLESNGFGRRSAGLIASLLRVNSSIKVLHVLDNPIGATGIKRIAEAIEENEVLEEICFQSNGPSSSFGESLGRALVHSKSLSRLFLVHNHLPTADLEILCEYAQHDDCKLSHLVLTGITIDDIGTQALRGLMLACMPLEKLCLWGNKINGKIAMALADGLLGNKSLHEFRIPTNDIQDDSVVAFAAAAAQHPVLTELDFTSNRITDVGGEALIEALKENPRIRKLRVHANDISKACRDEIQFRLNLNKAGRSLLSRVHSGFWPAAFERVNQKPEIMFELLREMPELGPTGRGEKKLPPELVEEEEDSKPAAVPT